MKQIPDLDAWFSGEHIECPVDGCDWTGRAVGQHCNWQHGIDADFLRELLGLCKGSSTATEDIGLARSVIAARTLKPEDRYDLTTCKTHYSKPRKQAIEHAKTARASAEAREKLRKAGLKSREPARRKANAYHLAITRARTTEKTCEECGAIIEASVLNAPLRKFCGQKCRNAFNRKRRKAEGK